MQASPLIPECLQYSARQFTILPWSSLSVCAESAIGENIEPFQVFSEHVPSTGQIFGLLDSWEYVRVFQSSYSSKHLSLQPFPPRLLVWMLFAPNCCSLPQQLWLIHLPVSVSSHLLPSPPPPLPESSALEELG